MACFFFLNPFKQLLIFSTTPHQIMNATVLIIIGTWDNVLAVCNRGSWSSWRTSAAFPWEHLVLESPPLFFPVAPFVNLCAGVSVCVWLGWVPPSPSPSFLFLLFNHPLVLQQSDIAIMSGASVLDGSIGFGPSDLLWVSPCWETILK